MVADMEPAVAVLFFRPVLAAKRRLCETNYGPDGLGNDDAAVSIDKLHARKGRQIAYKISE